MLFAFEPHPAAARLLRSALRTSPRCTVLEVAAADRDETAELVVPNGSFGTPISALAWVRNSQGGEDRRVLRITTRRIDSLIEDGTISVTGPVFMKIDVEGAEGRVLRGAAGLLRHHRPVVYFECQTHSAARQGETPDGVWDELGKVGYQIFGNRASRFISVGSIQPDIANYLAIPRIDDFEENQPLDALAIIAIIERWATRGSDY
jgi:FkbM family methyltransferase